MASRCSGVAYVRSGSARIPYAKPRRERSFGSGVACAAWCACDWNPRTTTSTRWRQASNFNESRYYNWFDAGIGMGGWVRMGNRPNEGYAEMTVCLLPARRPRRVQLQATEDRRSRGARCRRPALRGARALQGASRLIRRQGVRARSSARDGRSPKRRSRQPTRECTRRSHARGCRPTVGRRARVGRGRGQARPRSREDVRSRSHRAAHVDHGSGHGRRPERSTSPTRSACATTRGARVSGRTSGGTAGSP